MLAQVDENVHGPRRNVAAVPSTTLCGVVLIAVVVVIVVPVAQP